MAAERRGGWPGPRKPRKVIPQTEEQIAAVQEYAGREGVTYAEAMRRLVDAGLATLDNWTRPGRTGRPKKETR